MLRLKLFENLETQGQNHMANSMTVRILTEFRDGIRSVMTDAEISQTELAQKAHVKRHWVNQVLVGRRSVRVNRDMLESIQQSLLDLISSHRCAEQFRERLDLVFGKQLGYQEKIAENWSQVQAMQVATELLAGMLDDGLTKEQVGEVTTYLQALNSVSKSEKQK